MREQVVEILRGPVAKLLHYELNRAGEWSGTETTRLTHDEISAKKCLGPITIIKVGKDAGKVLLSCEGCGDFIPIRLGALGLP